MAGTRPRSCSRAMPLPLLHSRLLHACMPQHSCVPAHASWAAGQHLFATTRRQEYLNAKGQHRCRCCCGSSAGCRRGAMQCARCVLQACCMECLLNVPNLT